MADRPPIPGLAQDQGADDVPLAGTRHEKVQRLQVGLFGLAAMVMMVGLADIVIDRAMEGDAASVSEQPQAETDPAAPPARDPLAEAGVVPDIHAGGGGQAGPADGAGQSEAGLPRGERNAANDGAPD